MSRSLNNWPRGLIDLLQLKNSAVAWAMEDDVRATVDTFDIFAQAKIRQTSTTSATFVSGSQNVIQTNVPSGQLWFVYGVSGGLTSFEAGDVFQVELIRTVNFVQSNVLHVSPLVTCVNASQQVRAYRAFERPLILNSADGLILRANVNTLVSAPSVTGSLNIVYAPFGPATTSIGA